MVLVQSIAEGSHASGTSRKTELRLAIVARAGLEELRLAYDDFPRQRRQAQWPKEDTRQSRPPPALSAPQPHVTNGMRKR